MANFHHVLISTLVLVGTTALLVTPLLWRSCQRAPALSAKAVSSTALKALHRHSPSTVPHGFQSGKPFNASTYNSTASLFSAHSSWQRQALAMLVGAKAANHNMPTVVLVTLLPAGLGNRFPSIVTGYLMAVFSGSLFMLAPDSTFSNHMKVTVDADWGKYSTFYAGASRCDVGFDRLADIDLQWCKPDQPQNATIRSYTSIDYETPMLQLSPSIGRQLGRLVPAGNVFHVVSKFLLEPTALLVKAQERYQAKAEQCLVGLHIRTRKPYPHEGPHYIAPKQYVAAVQSVAQSLAGNVFLAADSQVFLDVAGLLPERQVWWTEETQASIDATSAVGGNPGSDLSAYLDIMILSRCKHIVLTAGSSFAPVAAGLSGTHPVHVVRGQHEQPFYSPWFWVSPTSEPCMFKASRILGNDVSNTTKKLILRHPLLWYFEQCQ